MEIIKIEVYKNGQAVACCNKNIKRVEIEVEGLPPMSTFSMPDLELERTKIFEHLNGRPLSAFFNESAISIEMSDHTEDLEPMFYVHGRSETMQGKTTINAVVLAHLKCPRNALPRIKQFASELPKIYKEVSKRL